MPWPLAPGPSACSGALWPLGPWTLPDGPLVCDRWTHGPWPLAVSSHVKSRHVPSRRQVGWQDAKLLVARCRGRKLVGKLLVGRLLVHLPYGRLLVHLRYDRLLVHLTNELAQHRQVHHR